MSLVDLIRKKARPVEFSTATPAAFATHDEETGRTVASVATVNVAKSLQEQKVSSDEAVITSQWWRIRYPNSASVEVSCTPKSTWTEILERHPDAISAEPFIPTVWKPSTRLSASDEAAMRAYLTKIKETDPATITKVIDQCQQDADARAFFLVRARLE